MLESKAFPLFPRRNARVGIRFPFRETMDINSLDPNLPNFFPIDPLNSDAKLR